MTLDAMKCEYIADKNGFDSYGWKGELHSQGSVHEYILEGFEHCRCSPDIPKDQYDRLRIFIPGWGNRPLQWYEHQAYAELDRFLKKHQQEDQRRDAGHL